MGNKCLNFFLWFLLSILVLTNGEKSCQYGLIGFSSGAHMVNKYHIIYSSHVNKVAMAAGFPWFYVDFNDFATAFPYLFNASLLNDLYDIDDLNTRLDELYQNNKIDNPDYLTNDYIYIFSSLYDAAGDNSYWIENIYSSIVDDESSQIKTNIKQIACDHAWLTDSNYDGELSDNCLANASPYMANYNYDLAFEILQFLYGVSSNSKQGYKENNLKKYVITDYIADGYNSDEIDFDDEWYVYKPKKCEKKKNKCETIVVFHGCGMSVSQIGTKFVLYNGLNEYANKNNLILIYPQLKPTSANFLGCWDWWGHNQSLLDIAMTKQEPRAITIHNFVTDIMDCDQD